MLVLFLFFLFMVWFDSVFVLLLFGLFVLFVCVWGGEKGAY